MKMENVILLTEKDHHTVMPFRLFLLDTSIVKFSPPPEGRRNPAPRVLSQTLVYGYILVANLNLKFAIEK